MRAALVLALAISLVAVAGGRVTDRSQAIRSRRSDRGQVWSAAGGYAIFAFAPASGVGMGTECSGLIPTGSKGEAFTYSRVGTATCINAAGTGFDLTTNQPAVSVCPGCTSGALGITIERAATNLVKGSYLLGGADWTATAAVTNDAFTGPFSAIATNRGLEQLNDSSGAALQGVSQLVASTTLYKHAVTAWLRSGTATSATISMVGTGNSAGDRTCTFTGLTTTPKRFGCVSTANYGAGLVSVVVSITVGTVASDTGTIGAGDVQLESDNFWGAPSFSATSYVPTGLGATATRGVVSAARFTHPAAVTNTVGCYGGSYYRKQYDTETPDYSELIVTGTFFTIRQQTSGGVEAQSFDSTNTIATAGGAGSSINTLVRVRNSWSGSTQTVNTSLGGSASGAYDGTMIGGFVDLGGTVGGNNTNGWTTAVVVDSTTAGCL